MNVVEALNVVHELQQLQETAFKLESHARLVHVHTFQVWTMNCRGTLYESVIWDNTGCLVHSEEYPTEVEARLGHTKWMEWADGRTEENLED